MGRKHRQKKRKHKSQTRGERSNRHEGGKEYFEPKMLASSPERRQKLYEMWKQNELNQQPRKHREDKVQESPLSGLYDMEQET